MLATGTAEEETQEDNGQEGCQNYCYDLDGNRQLGRTNNVV